MSNQDILNQLKPQIQCEKEITLQTPCEEVLDSFGFIQLVLHCESLFDITISDEDLFLGQYIVINDFVDMLMRRISQRK